MKKIINFFKTSPNITRLTDPQKIEHLYKQKRFQVFTSLVLGYGFFYTCRLSMSVAKKPMLAAGVLDVKEMGIIGAVLLYIYAFGKFSNGFLADRANIKKFMSIALLCSAVLNLLFGLTSNFYIFVILWALNGWFQSIGSAPSVVSIFQWFSKKERGAKYGIWGGSHSIGEAITFVGTAFLISAFGWRAGFIAPGIICIIVALLMYKFLGDRPETYGLPPIEEYQDDKVEEAAEESKASIASLQKTVLKSPIVWVLGLSSALMYVARYAITGWAILFLQETKGYTLIEAGSTMAAYPFMGFFGAVFSGYISDKFFKSNRHIPALFYGILQTLSLIVLWKNPAGYLIIDAIALGAFGFGIGGLVVYLAGLIAVDMMPTRAAGAVKGIIGLFSYVGAATQYLISGVLINNTKTIVNGEVTHDYTMAFYFWIGASVVSMLLMMSTYKFRNR